MSDGGGFSLLKDEDNVEVGLTPNQQRRIATGGTHAPPSMALGASSLEMQAHAALDSCNGLPWRHLTVLYILAGSAFITALVAASKAGVTTSTEMDASAALSAVTCPYGDIIWGDTVHEYNGHYYQIIGGQKDAQGHRTSSITWVQAVMDANARCWKGNPGYLVNIDSEEENNYLKVMLKGSGKFVDGDHAWIGATDMKVESQFSWIGPQRMMVGTPFWRGGVNGEAVDDRYNNWASSGGVLTEPNENGGEDCVEMRTSASGTGEDGHWNDANCYNQNRWFIVEFGNPAVAH